MFRNFPPSLFIPLTLIGGSVQAGEIEGTIRMPKAEGLSSPAVVYVATARSDSSAARQSVTVDQQNLQFVPRVQAVSVGGTIEFRNSELRELHNVNSKSGCCNFNHMMPPGSRVEVRARQPGLVRLLCDIHHHMRGFVMVCPSALFAVTDSHGRFKIENVPDGVHRIVVWQELSKLLERELAVVGQTQVDFDLEASGESLPPARPTPARPVVAWTEVRRQIANTLEAAIRAAQHSGGGQEAERLALNAYFREFEASGFETAVLRFQGDDRVYDLERMFKTIRKPLLADLAAGRIGPEPVRAAVADLLQALKEESDQLVARGILDRTSLDNTASFRVGPAAASPDSRQVLQDLQKAFEQVEQCVVAGNSAGAASLLADAYFEIFHRLEPALAAHDFVAVREIEDRFFDLRGRLQVGMSVDAAHQELGALRIQIERAAATLDSARVQGMAATLGAFSNALVILTREGVEALLIVTALLMYLNRVRQPQGKRAIYAGLLVALLATGGTWFVLQWLIARSGAARETIEGIVTLAAVAVLFYVSYWLISNSEARRWREFLTRQVGRGISSGSWWALALTAFLAVYREGAETILMFQPMVVHPTPNQLAGVVAGVVAAGAVLSAIFWALRFASFRIAIRPFFRVTGALLFILAVVFAGKGISDLQEAGHLANTPLPDALRQAILWLPGSLRDALGLAPTMQALAVQGTLLAGAAASVAALWWIGRWSPVAREQAV